METFGFFSAAKLCSQAAAGEPDVGGKSNSDDEGFDFCNSRVQSASSLLPASSTTVILFSLS